MYIKNVNQNCQSVILIINFHSNKLVITICQNLQAEEMARKMNSFLSKEALICNHLVKKNEHLNSSLHDVQIRSQTIICIDVQAVTVGCHTNNPNGSRHCQLSFKLGLCVIKRRICCFKKKHLFV